MKQNRIWPLFLFGLILFAFPQTARANQPTEMLNLYYYVFNIDGTEYFTSEEIEVPEAFTTQQKAFIIYSNLFENHDNDKISFTPEGVKLLDVAFFDDSGLLLINVSEEIKNYGGTYYEYYLVKQIMKNAIEISGVSHVTLLIEGASGELPESTKIFETSIYEYFTFDPSTI